jgi:hypothetical protein
MRWIARAAMAGVISLALAGVAKTDEKKVTWTGWFSDLQCASSRAGAGVFGATNPDCAQKCIEKGVAPAFISEQVKAVFQVKESASVIDDLAYHVEVQATVDEAAKTIKIEKVKRMEYQGPACARPRKTAKQ